MREGKVNREWHEAHVMPSNPSREQRLEWHAEHAQHCACRGVPPSLAGEVKALTESRGRSA